MAVVTGLVQSISVGHPFANTYAAVSGHVKIGPNPANVTTLNFFGPVTSTGISEATVPEMLERIQFMLALMTAYVNQKEVTVQHDGISIQIVSF